MSKYIHGPFSNPVYTQLPNGTTILVQNTVWSRQSLPYTEPLAHVRGFALPEKSVDGINWFRDNYPVGKNFDSYRFAHNRPLTWPTNYGSARARAGSAHAQAYDRYVASVDEKAQLAITLAESQQAWDMISKRCDDLLKGVTAWRRRDWDGLVKVFGYQQVSKSVAPETYTRGWFAGRSRQYRLARRRRIVRTTLDKRWKDDAANGWLELNLGWIPVVEDISAAVEVLQQDFPEYFARGRGKSVWDFYETVETASGSVLEWGTVNIRYHIQGQVQVINPNLRLANNLGFVNLPAAAWALVPGSFLLDWFIPVGKFVNSWTDMLGYAVKRSSTSSLVNADVGSDSSYDSGAVVLRRSIGSYGFFRDIGVSTPDLLSRSVMSNPDRLRSWWKALTSFALLFQAIRNR